MSPRPGLDAAERTAWIRFAMVSQGIPAELNTVLLAGSQLGQFEYLVLNFLNLSADGSLSMSRLAEYTSSSLSRLSHAVARLERAGSVERSRSAADGRVTIATLTDRGRERFRAAAPAYFAAVRRLVFDRLDADDVADLDRIMSKLLPGVDPGGTLAPIATVAGSR